MIMLTKEQLADLLREAFKLGACLGVVTHKSWIDSEPFHHSREHAIQPLVRRSSGGHDDRGREVE